MLKAIVAATPEGGIAKNGRIPWYIPEDLKLFKRLTLGNTVIMGRKTYETLPHPLADRANVVLTRGTIKEAECFVHMTVHKGKNVFWLYGQDAPRKAAKAWPNAWVIGGAEIYRQMLPLCEELYLSRIHQSYECDTFLPPLDGWRTEETIHSTPEFTLYRMTRTHPPHE